MNSIDKLTEIFSHFPGIGPRQAKRFVYYLLSRNKNFTDDLQRAIEELKREITQCTKCYRFFPKNSGQSPLCSICRDTTREHSMLMIIPRDIDLDAVERSGSFHGYYFVLGGSLPILEKEPSKKIRINELLTRLNTDPEIQEVVLAMNANSEGENTADFLREHIHEKKPELTISILGRGLSTGAELEYADPDTLKNAFLHRTQ